MKLKGILLNQIVDKQFEIIGVDMKFADIPEDEMVQVGDKKKPWWQVYHFTDEQEKEWREWMIKASGGRLSEQERIFIELRYGFVLDYSKKKGSI